MRLRVITIVSMSAALLATAGCGSAQRDLLARAMRQPVTDARFAMVMSMTQGGSDLVHATVDGPYHSNGPDRLPSFDFNVHFAVTTIGSTKDVAFEAISSGDDVFVRYDGVTYDVGKARVAAYQRRALRNQRRLGNPRTLGDFQRLGLHIDSWFPDSQILGDETLDGQQVTHLHGKIDVGAVIRDFTKLMATRSLHTGGRQQVTPAMIRQVENAIADPTYDVYVDKASGAFRRLAGHADIDIPGAPKFGLDMRFDILDAGQPQTITAPTADRPIDDLLALLKSKYGIDFGAAMAHSNA